MWLKYVLKEVSELPMFRENEAVVRDRLWREAVVTNPKLEQSATETPARSR